MTKATKKNLLIFIIIALLIGVSAAVVLHGRNRESVVSEKIEQVNVEGVGVPEGKEPFSGVATLKDLAKDGKDLECQVVFERSEAEGNIEGTYFTSKGNFRSDFIIPASEFGGKVLSSMIVGGNSMYVWTTIDKNTFGFKSDLNTAVDSQVDSKEPVPVDENVKYTCTEWTEVDGSVFVPPADVTFQDQNAAVNAGMEYGTLPE